MLDFFLFLKKNFFHQNNGLVYWHLQRWPMKFFVFNLCKLMDLNTVDMIWPIKVIILSNAPVLSSLTGGILFRSALNEPFWYNPSCLWYFSFFLVQQDVPVLSCVFPVPNLESAISLKGVGLFLWEMIYWHLIWMLGSHCGWVGHCFQILMDVISSLSLTLFFWVISKSHQLYQTVSWIGLVSFVHCYSYYPSPSFRTLFQATVIAPLFGLPVFSLIS